MADLYTSLSRAKQILMATREWRGEGPPPAPPAMTPVPEELHEIIDPALTIGMGALRECGDTGHGCPECGRGECQGRGLQCPVRGCGKWVHDLSQHANSVHVDLGGANGIRRLLSIPKTAALGSTARKEASRRTMKGLIKEGRVQYGSIRHHRKRQHDAARGETQSATKQTTGYRNLLNSCEAQIAQRMQTLVDRLGRAPSQAEANAMDPGLVSAATSLHGSWNNAKVQMGLALRWGDRSTKKEAALSALAEWHKAHGTLPSSKEAQRPDRTPLIPGRAAILTALGKPSWEEAMQVAADALGLPAVIVADGRFKGDARPVAVVPPTPVDPDEFAAWEDMVSAGKTTHEMAEEVDADEPDVRNTLRRLGLLDRAFQNNTRREWERRRSRVA